MSKALSKLAALLKSNQKIAGSDYTATVTRVEDGIAYVQMSGAEITDTPVAMTINAAAGDKVRVRVNGGKAWLVGNDAHPPTDDTKATAAHGIAVSANNRAEEAYYDAEAARQSAIIAGEAAGSAQRSAATANTAANNALLGLSTLEHVVDTVNWFAAHKKASTDTTVDSSKTYYIYDSATGTLTEVIPEGTENPSEEGWYELDEAIANYVAAHVATTVDGLSVVGTPTGYRVLISTGNGSYDPGIYLIDGSGNVVASYGETARIGKEDEAHIDIGADSIEMTADNGTPVMRIGFTDYVDYNGIRSDVIQFPGEAPCSITVPWDVKSGTTIMALDFFTASGGKIDGIDTSGHYTLTGNVITLDAGLCNALITNDCEYIEVEYYASGRFPYYTLGTRGPESSPAPFSYVLGLNGITKGAGSMVIGNANVANGENALVAGDHNIAWHNELCVGTYNDPSVLYAITVGNGISEDDRSNAFYVTTSGKVWAAGDVVFNGGTSVQDMKDNLDRLPPQILYGSTSVSVSGGGYTDVSVTFSKAFSAAPVVVVGFSSGSTDGNFGKVSCAVTSATTTGCTLRVFNGDTATRTPGLRWIATGEA